mgnify:FL=1|jgi:hypothetical protein|tara:strand:- start:481 stop:1455 length:975 start_codon:yes stop_codon:yes gene_type:complete
MYQFVIPVHHVTWSTRSVLEGIYEKYNPKHIYVITSENEIKILKDKLNYWKIKNLTLLDEDNFFLNKYSLTKNDIVSQITQNKPNYTPGWLYQQIIKLGANDAIEQLDDVFVVWDSDLLPVNSWPILDKKKEKFALLQDKSYGNQDILNSWKNLIINVLGINPVEDERGTFTSHHMIFKKKHLKSLKLKFKDHFKSDQNWIKLIIKAANIYGSFGEYWTYASWVNHINKDDLNYYPYEKYGLTTERFFDDGNGLFSKNYKKHISFKEQEDFYPSYSSILNFIRKNYRTLPSSLSFETNIRHTKKRHDDTHLEEKRSIWREKKPN